MKKYFPFVFFSLAGFALYAMTFDDAFQFDAIGYIQRNPLIRDITDLSAIWHSIKPGTRFITMLTFALNYHFHHYDVFGYHLVNTIIHIINASLVYIFVRLLFRARALNITAADEGRAVAFFSALIFLVHPIQTQAVTYVAQRFASLATLFYLLSLIFFLKMRLERERKILYGVLLTLSALLGIFSKEIVITLPLMLVVFETVLFQKEGRNIFRKFFSWKYLLPAGIFISILPFLFRFDVHSILLRRVPSGSHEGDFVTFSNYIFTQFTVIPYYIRLLFVPIGQNLDHDWPVSASILDLKVIAGILFLAAIFIWAFKVKQKNNLAFLGIMFFFIALSLESVIPIIHVIFEYRLYLPMVGFSVFLSAFLWQMIREKKIYYAVLSIFCIVLSFGTIHRNSVWADGISLWSDAVKGSPNKSRPYMNLGIAYLEAGNADKAMEYFNRSIAIYSTVKALNNRAVLYSNLGQYELALTDYTSVIEHFPDYEEVINNRAVVYQKMKKYDLALKDFKALEEGWPGFDELYKNRADLYKEMGNIEAAIGDYAKFLELNPGVAEAFNERGILCKRLGRYEEALQDYNSALKLDKSSYLVYNNRGNVYKETGRYELALSDYAQAVKLNPQDPVAYVNRALVYFALKDPAAALQDAVKASELGYKGLDGFIEQLRKNK